MFAHLSKVVYWFDLKILCWRLKKDAVIIQIKTRKKKISNQNKTHQLLLFFLWEKKETRKNPSHTYIPTTQNQNHIVVRRRIFQISQKKMRLSEAACVAVEPKKQNAYQGVTEVYLLLLLFCWMNLTVLSKCDRKVRVFFLNLILISMTYINITLDS